MYLTSIQLPSIELIEILVIKAIYIYIYGNTKHLCEIIFTLAYMVKGNTQIQIGVQFSNTLKIEDNPIKYFRHLVHRPLVNSTPQIIIWLHEFQS